VVKLVSGSISLSDFAWPAVDEDMVVERAFQRMLPGTRLLRWRASDVDAWLAVNVQKEARHG